MSIVFLRNKAAAAPSGTQFSEDFSGFTVTDTWTEISSTWTRSNSGSAEIIADGDGPSGKGMQLLHTNFTRAFYSLTSVVSHVNSNGALDSEVFMQVKADVINSDAGVGTLNAGSSGSATGYSALGTIKLYDDADLGGGAAETDLASYTAGDNAVWNLLFRVNAAGDVVSGKAWKTGDSEPSYTDQAGTEPSFSGDLYGPYTRGATTTDITVLFVGWGFDTTAPRS